jgi:hypothetical protein
VGLRCRSKSPGWRDEKEKPLGSAIPESVREDVVPGADNREIISELGIFGKPSWMTVSLGVKTYFENQLYGLLTQIRHPEAPEGRRGDCRGRLRSLAMTIYD